MKTPDKYGNSARFVAAGLGLSVLTACSAFSPDTINSGFSPDGAAAVVASVIYESDADPLLNTKYSRGILGWTPSPSGGRWESLEIYADETVQDSGDIRTQLDFIPYDYKNLGLEDELLKLQHSDDHATASRDFTDDYIRPARSCYDSRAMIASMVYESFDTDS